MKWFVIAFMLLPVLCSGQTYLDTVYYDTTGSDVISDNFVTGQTPTYNNGGAGTYNYWGRIDYSSGGGLSIKYWTSPNYICYRIPFDTSSDYTLVYCSASVYVVNPGMTGCDGVAGLSNADSLYMVWRMGDEHSPSLGTGVAQACSVIVREQTFYYYTGCATGWGGETNPVWFDKDRELARVVYDSSYDPLSWRHTVALDSILMDSVAKGLFGDTIDIWLGDAAESLVFAWPSPDSFRYSPYQDTIYRGPRFAYVTTDCQGKVYSDTRTADSQKPYFHYKVQIGGAAPSPLFRRRKLLETYGSFLGEKRTKWFSG